MFKDIFKIFTIVFFLLICSFASYAQKSDSLIKAQRKELKREKMKVGLTGLGGLSNAYGGTLEPGTTRFRPAWGIGGHIYLPIGKQFYIHYMLGYAKRGFNYRIRTNIETATHFRERLVIGHTKLNFLDKNLTVGCRFSNTISVFTGINLGVRLRAKTEYDVEDVIINKSTQQQTVRNSSYSKTGGDTSQDVIDYAILFGVRARLHENIAISIRYLHDFYGLNFGGDMTSEGNSFLATSSYDSSGIFFTLEGHIFSFSRKRKKETKN
ncbi:MAG: hypothetical protein ACK40G_07665 [Cytophagaceae bacterium]